MRTAFSMLGLFVAATAAVAEVRVLGSAEADGKAPIVAVISAKTMDMVIVDGGHNRGFRPGAVCSVSRDGRSIGAVVIAESSRYRAVALILSLESTVQINSGDLVSPRANPRL